MAVGAAQSVLIVEDSWLLAAEVQQWLEDDGVEVVGLASNADEALDVVDRTQPGFALVDFNLGGELAGPLIEKLLLREMAVVVVTGYSDVGATAANVAAVLRKPCKKRDVMDALRAAGLRT